VVWKCDRGSAALKGNPMMNADIVPTLPGEVIIRGQELSSSEVLAVSRRYAPVTLAPSSLTRIKAARRVIDRMAEEGRKVYGVTTGFGHLSRVPIPRGQLPDLQHNLLRSHAAGVGEPLSEDVVRAMMLLLAASLARGNSGVRVDVINLLLSILNARFYPVIPSRGSVGASGDLAPLAHLGLILIGEGEVVYRGEQLPGCGTGSPASPGQRGVGPDQRHAPDGGQRYPGPG